MTFPKSPRGGPAELEFGVGGACPAGRGCAKALWEEGASVEKELPADRGAESRMGGWGTSWEESTAQTTQDASATSGAGVFILRAVGSLRKVLSRGEM